MVQEMALCIADNENNRDLLRVAYSELGDRIHWEQGNAFMEIRRVKAFLELVTD